MNSRKISVLAAAALLCSGISAVAQEKIPYLDPDRPRAERVEDLPDFINASPIFV